MLIQDPTIELQESLPPLTQLNFVSVKELRSLSNSIVEVKQLLFLLPLLSLAAHLLIKQFN